jgi:hypothetical protein
MFGNAIALWFVFLILICLGAGALGGLVVLRGNKRQKPKDPGSPEIAD